MQGVEWCFYNVIEKKKKKIREKKIKIISSCLDETRVRACVDVYYTSLYGMRQFASKKKNKINK